MKIYRGWRERDAGGEITVTVSEEGFSKELRHFNKHSPDGFEWGYGGSGPADLAYAIVYDVLGDHDKAWNAHQGFKWQHISPLQEDDWEITEDQVREFIMEHYPQLLQEDKSNDDRTHPHADAQGEGAPRTEGEGGGGG